MQKCCVALTENSQEGEGEKTLFFFLMSFKLQLDPVMQKYMLVNNSRQAKGKINGVARPYYLQKSSVTETSDRACLSHENGTNAFNPEGGKNLIEILWVEFNL